MVLLLPRRLTSSLSVPRWDVPPSKFLRQPLPTQTSFCQDCGGCRANGASTPSFFQFLSSRAVRGMGTRRTPFLFNIAAQLSLRERRLLVRLRTLYSAYKSRPTVHLVLSCATHGHSKCRGRDPLLVSPQRASTYCVVIETRCAILGLSQSDITIGNSPDPALRISRRSFIVLAKGLDSRFETSPRLCAASL